MVEVKCPLCAEKSSIEEVTENQKIFALKHALMAVYNWNMIIPTFINASYKCMWHNVATVTL